MLQACSHCDAWHSNSDCSDCCMDFKAKADQIFFVSAKHGILCKILRHNYKIHVSFMVFPIQEIHDSTAWNFCKWVARWFSDNEVIVELCLGPEQGNEAHCFNYFVCCVKKYVNWSMLLCPLEIMWSYYMIKHNIMKESCTKNKLWKQGAVLSGFW